MRVRSLVLVAFVLLGSLAHHHGTAAPDAPANCPACELNQTTPVAPAALGPVVAPPPRPYAPPAARTAPAPRAQTILDEAPKTSPPV